jgi:hypothetical protein
METPRDRWFRTGVVEAKVDFCVFGQYRNDISDRVGQITHCTEEGIEGAMKIAPYLAQGLCKKRNVTFRSLWSPPLLADVFCFPSS